MMKKRMLGRLNSLFKLAQGKEVEMETFEDRLTFQKTIYLLHSLGIEGLPKQSWYVKGPYSFNLATSGFMIWEAKERPTKEIPECEAEKIAPLREAFAPEMEDFDKIELLVSAVYVFKEEKIMDIENAAKWIMGKKPWYKPGETRQMLQKVLEKRRLFGF
ncbi:hypothetical protein JW721_00630 [Candidatus Micrarchaeota archaeon]|nr:hypothetical protein [Candidatus Micrarchaeota archaeon]